jgi:hypothetical protein
MVTPEDSDVEGCGDVPFREASDGKLCRFLVSLTVALAVGFLFSYLLDEKIGVLLFIQAFAAGIGGLVGGSGMPKEPYIIGDSGEILYLTKEELKKRMEG